MATQTAYEKALKNLEKVLADKYEDKKGIMKQGDRIIVPEGMSFAQAAEAIMEYAKQMEETVKNQTNFDVHPEDGLAAFYYSIQELFGELQADYNFGMFGQRKPGTTYTVHTSYNETLQVPIGNAKVPGLPIEFYIAPQNDHNSEVGGSLIIQFTYQRKYELLVQEIIDKMNRHLKEHSIFLGKAINSKFEFIDVSKFDPSRIVYNKNVLDVVEGEILGPIRNSQRWRDNGMSLKRGVLMYGPYGTGKTLTARHVAKVAIDSGWTFVNVMPGDDITRALRFARRYQPCVVFFEDIDTETSTNQTRVNEILNTISDILVKDAEVITVLTTNHVDTIARGMLRPERLDTVIELSALEPEATIRLINVCLTDKKGRTLLDGDLSFEAIEEAAEGYTPAFVVEGVTKAKAYAINRGETDRVSGEDVVRALRSLRGQWNMMQSDQRKERPILDVAMGELVVREVKPLLEDLIYENGND